jgi:MFS family permease
VGLLFVAYTAMGTACGALNACFGAIAILRIPESGRGQAMAIIGGMTRAVSIAALAIGGLLGALLPVRLSFLITGAGGVLVALAVAAYVLPRFGREGAVPLAVPVPVAVPPSSVSGGEQEAVAHQVGHLVEEPLPERRAVISLVAAQQGVKGADDLPDGELAVAR